MCGIMCFLSHQTTEDQNDKIVDTTIGNLKNRGPDHFDDIVLPLNSFWRSRLSASVLHTQGADIQKQPIINKNGNFLLWNGDIFESKLAGSISPNVSDASIMFQWLSECPSSVPNLISSIEGPYSFIFYDSSSQKIWFGRDPLGRHSLLWSLEESSLLITSVGHQQMDLAEVPSVGFFCLDLSQDNLNDLVLYPWSHFHLIADSFKDELPNFLKLGNPIHFFKCELESKVNDGSSYFPTSVLSSDISSTLKSLLKNDEILKSVVSELLDLLLESCRKRVQIRRPFCRECTNESLCSENHAKVGILFSGGLDSTVIAFLADKFVPCGEAIDLINVAFMNNGGRYEVPDRKTGLASYEELSHLCANRQWNFIEVNVTESELEIARCEHICHLIHPLNTVLDDSLGCALWFASRAKGCLNGVPYTSTAKILLLGSGADEQFGGYIRHRNILKQVGWTELNQQLLLETFRISKRNLGRDDRIVSDNGRQPRFPFLDEKIVQFSMRLPANQKCGPVSYPPGLGDKLILRLVATKLGLKQCAAYPKRAFQFGCRIANRKENGRDKCIRL